MKTSFAKGEPKEEPREEVSTAVLIPDEDSAPETSLVSLRTSALTIGQTTGDLSAHDIQVPRLSLVQSVGPLSEKFENGQFVLNKEHVLANKEENLGVIVASIHKFYEEQLPYDPDGPRPRTFETIEEVREAGLWIDWRDDERPPAREAANVLLVLEKPKDLLCPSFTMTFKGVDRALAMMTLRGKAYTIGAKRIFSAAAIELARSGLLSGQWDLYSTREKAGKNLVWCPNFKLKPERLTREDIDALKGLICS